MTIEFQIKAKEQFIKYSDKYVATIHFMHGDGDFDDTVVVAYSDAETMKKLLEVLNNCSQLYPNGKSGYDSYQEAENFALFFDDWDLEVEDDFEPLDELTWPSNEGIVASYAGVDVSYYDVNGIEHEVIVKY